MGTMEIAYSPRAVEELTATDLREEAEAALAAGDRPEAERIIMYKPDGRERGGDIPQALYLPDAGRGGVAWGADASWTDCDSMADLVARWHRARNGDPTAWVE